MFAKKWVIWPIIALILCLPAPALVKYLHTYIVRNAVVTAFCYDVRAPIDGVIGALKIRPGDIPDSSPVLTITNSRLPLAGIAGLESGQTEKQKYLAELHWEQTELERRLEQNRQVFIRYRTTLQEDLAQTLAILRAEEEAEAARLDEAAKNRDRILTLVTTAVATREKADQAEAEFIAARSRLAANRLEQSQVRHRSRMLKENLLPPDLSDAALQVRNRIHTLETDLLGCRRQIRAMETDISVDALRASALRKDRDNRTVRADIVLPRTAVLWDVSTGPGMEVAKGDRLLSYIDRDSLMVDVAVDDATLELITPGHPARIRLFGSREFITGQVIRVLGSAAELPDHRLAAQVKDKSPREGRVLVRIDHKGLYEDTQRFCGIGRTAYAEFEGIGLMELYLGTFLR